MSTTWSNLLKNKSGVVLRPINFLKKQSSRRRSMVHAPAVGNPKDFVEAASLASRDALRKNNLLEFYSPTRVGVSVGSGVGSLEIITKNHDMVSQGKKISPFFVPSMLINLAAGRISIENGFRGPLHASSTACATGAHSIGDAYLLIRAGMADAMIAGGTENAANTELDFAGFEAMKALSTNESQNPEESSRPFAFDRDGFVMGSGSALVILEDLQCALSRNAEIFAEIVGYGSTSDAFHIVRPRLDGKGAVEGMNNALKSVPPHEVVYVNAHATSTPLGDAIECRAISEVFADRAKPRISSTKGHFGHLLGAAGSLEAAVSIEVIRKGVLPTTLNLSRENLDSDLSEFADLFIWECEETAPMYALTNSFGFGGTNASLCFKRWNDDGP